MDHHHALTHLAIMLAAAFLGGAIFQKLKQPALVGYIVVGIILGLISVHSSFFKSFFAHIWLNAWGNVKIYRPNDLGFDAFTLKNIYRFLDKRIGVRYFRRGFQRAV